MSLFCANNMTNNIPLASIGWAECQRSVFLASGRPNLRQPLSSEVSAFSC